MVDQLTKERSVFFDEKCAAESKCSDLENTLKMVCSKHDTAVEELKVMKQLVDSLSQSLADHERDSEMLSSKLINMKMDMMEHEEQFGLRRKFAAVKVSGQRLQACTVSYC